MHDDQTRNPLNRTDDSADQSPEATAQDRTMDANLRAIGPSLGLPGGLSQERIAAFRAMGHSTPRISRSDSDASDSPGRRRPRSRWLAIGSAMAACVAIGTALFSMSSGSRVEASTILNDLRQRQVSGIDIDLMGLGAEGVTVNGMLRLRLQRPVTVDQLGDADMDGNGPGAVYAKLAVETDATVNELPNARFGMEMAFSPNVGWVYLIADDATADRIQQVEPRAAFISNMARSGLLVNIGAIDEDLLAEFGLDGSALAEFEDARLQAHDQAQRTGVAIRVRQRAEINVSGDLNNLTDEQIQSINEAQRALDRVSNRTPADRLVVETDAEGRRTVRLAAETQSGDASSVDSAGQRAESADDARMRGIENAVRSLLTGTARQGELDQIRNLLTQANGTATVRNLGRGEYELVADLRDETARPGEAGSAQLTVRYLEDQGVQWVELSRIDGATGSIRLAFAGDPIAPELMNADRLITVGRTNYVDLRAMLPMIRGALPGMTGE